MSRSVTDPRLCFVGDFFDELAGIWKEYQVLFFYQDQSVEMTDIKTRKAFLKRCPCKNLTRAQFYIGARVVIFGRVLRLRAYADEVTRQLVESTNEKALLVVAEDAFHAAGTIFIILQQELELRFKNFQVVHNISIAAAAEITGDQGFPKSFAKRRLLVLELVGEHAVDKVNTMPGRMKGLSQCFWVYHPTSATSAAAPAKGGAATNAVAKEGEQLTAAAAAPVGGLDAVFEKLAELGSPSSGAVLGMGQGTSTIVIIKPHIVASGNGGEILQRLLSIKNCGAVHLTAMSQMCFSQHYADRFLNVYKGLLEDYKATVEHMSSGSCWVLQLVSGGGDGPDDEESFGDVLSAVREVCGPFDPVLAKNLRPSTIRAKFGLDRVQNAVHCSDLTDDGAINAEFFFS